jgi:hypothetical protein
MFLFSCAAVAAAGFGAWWSAGRSIAGTRHGVLFLAALAIGDIPEQWGRRVDRHDAYAEQFQSIFRPAGLSRHGSIDWGTAALLGREHARILALECLPRLLAGHILPGFGSEPRPDAFGRRPAGRRAAAADWIGIGTTTLSLAIFSMGAISLVAWRPDSAVPLPTAAVRLALIGTSAVLIGAFLVNLNIYNSDNYRYLVVVFPAGAIGVGMALGQLTARGRTGWALAVALASAFGVLTTLDTLRWYQRFGWVDGAGRPVRLSVRDPVLDWLAVHPEVGAIFGSYWDVYRLSFLTGGRVRGVPFPTYPDRFPEWGRELPDHRPRILIARTTGEGRYYREFAVHGGGKELYRTAHVSILLWP